MSDSDWWARRLGRAPQQQQPQARQQAPVYHQQPSNYPPVQQRQYQQPQAPQYQQSPNIRVTPDNLYEATQYWQGGEAHRKEIYSCPQCGGGHFFSRSSQVSRGPAPAPMCYDCGYNGMFQQGDPSNYSS